MLRLSDPRPAAVSAPGRSCPLAYRYSPLVFARPADFAAETVYVVGGLYGNRAALDAILQLAAAEPVAPRIVFNGDFNWFNIDDAGFAAVNEVVLEHVALRGNVETELAGALDDGDAGCGCGYPDSVADVEVARSNAIMANLRETAARSPALRDRLCGLAMHAVAEVGGIRVGIVHGDAESLAGWRFAHDALDKDIHLAWLTAVCEEARLAGFASSHTCLPALRRTGEAEGARFVINNGAAGMPNFAGTNYGLLSRISVIPPAAALTQYGLVQGGLHIDAVPVFWDQDRFLADFLRNWPPASPAHAAYFRRIVGGPSFTPARALGLVAAGGPCG